MNENQNISQNRPGADPIAYPVAINALVTALKSLRLSYDEHEYLKNCMESLTQRIVTLEAANQTLHEQLVRASNTQSITDSPVKLQ